jgi:hypothetical protein
MATSHEAFAAAIDLCCDSVGLRGTARQNMARLSQAMFHLGNTCVTFFPEHAAAGEELAAIGLRHAQANQQTAPIIAPLNMRHLTHDLTAFKRRIDSTLAAGIDNVLRAVPRVANDAHHSYLADGKAFVSQGHAVTASTPTAPTLITSPSPAAASAVPVARPR